ncbi:hypothetical protein BH23BAC3_BH23BAC3_00670 [soil metagenome]
MLLLLSGTTPSIALFASIFVFTILTMIYSAAYILHVFSDDSDRNKSAIYTMNNIIKPTTN